MVADKKHLTITLSLALSLVSTGGALSQAPTAGVVAKQDYRQLNTEGMRLQSEGKLDEAAEHYRQAIQLHPTSSASHNNLALVLKDLGDFDGAEKEARYALKLKPSRGDYHFNLGVILEKENKLSDAEQEYKEAIRDNALDAESHYRLAQVLNSSDRAADAEAEIKLALLLKPNNGHYLILYGDILNKLGNREQEALNEYRLAKLAGAGKDEPADLQNKIDSLQQALKTH